MKITLCLIPALAFVVSVFTASVAFAHQEHKKAADETSMGERSPGSRGQRRDLSRASGANQSGDALDALQGAISHAIAAPYVSNSPPSPGPTRHFSPWH